MLIKKVVNLLIKNQIINIIFKEKEDILMKLIQKETLLLGGLYGVFDTSFSLFNFEILRDILFIVFLVSLVMLCFNKTPQYVSFVAIKYPKTSYYLSAIGWVTYFMILALLIFLISQFFINYSDDFFAKFAYGLMYCGACGAVLSLIFAFIKARKQ